MPMTFKIRRDNLKDLLHFAIQERRKMETEQWKYTMPSGALQSWEDYLKSTEDGAIGIVISDEP